MTLFEPMPGDTRNAQSDIDPFPCWTNITNGNKNTLALSHPSRNATKFVWSYVHRWIDQDKFDRIDQSADHGTGQFGGRCCDDSQALKVDTHLGRSSPSRRRNTNCRHPRTGLDRLAHQQPPQCPGLGFDQRTAPQPRPRQHRMQTLVNGVQLFVGPNHRLNPLCNLFQGMNPRQLCR